MMYDLVGESDTQEPISEELWPQLIRLFNSMQIEFGPKSYITTVT